MYALLVTWRSALLVTWRSALLVTWRSVAMFSYFAVYLSGDSLQRQTGHDLLLSYMFYRVMPAGWADVMKLVASVSKASLWGSFYIFDDIRKISGDIPF